MRSLRSGVLLVGALAALGCGSSESIPTVPADIGGTWNFAVSIANGTLQTSCDATGTVVINQAGNLATGTYSESASCTTPAGTTQTNVSGSISGGKVSGTKVSFNDDGGCRYSGTASGSPADAMSGTVKCTVAVNMSSYTSTGTWTASR